MWAMLSALVERGAVLITDAPIEQHTVARIAQMIGPLQPQIYGELFDVRVTHDPINLAYSTEAIGAHMDLCYYESPPGLQLLHCIQHDAHTGGGESLLIDGFAAVEQLRAEQPDAFAALSRIPATFIKDHSKRKQPVLMSYQRPHISLDATGALIGLFWSPPFEGPLRVPVDDIPPYYRAYRQLQRTIDSAPQWTHRLAPGEVLVFNNRRMLHGRTAIHAPSEQSAARWLQGCYINIDEFMNRYNKLRREFGQEELARAHSIGNQDWALPQYLCVLPPDCTRR
uniref:TauD/TfdA-like domain-containing protein n=1 Tax=Calcidiscus leptoporus TaxID=127549 RepID=A0A7S0J2F9_9EUKA